MLVGNLKFSHSQKMEIDSSETSNWLFDYGFVEQISVPGDPFPSSISGSFSWAPQPLNCPFNNRLGSVLLNLTSLFGYRESEGKQKEKVGTLKFYYVFLFPRLYAIKSKHVLFAVLRLIFWQ